MGVRLIGDHCSLSMTSSSESVYFTFTLHSSIPGIGKRIFSSLKCPNRFWISPNFLFEGHKERTLSTVLKRSLYEAGHLLPCRADVKNQ